MGAFILHVFDELPYAEITARTGTSVSMIEKHIAAAGNCSAGLASLALGDLPVRDGVGGPLSYRPIT
ncbi:sigma factor-like helix-turn-helix DNA-binding protein [Bordetella trematum]|uniref:sigma factor-like helix-turn-helix DNA-binding protein n=1 Tax=Bordetella trematum TaxID=123899 RepID=UPI003C7DB3C6